MRWNITSERFKVCCNSHQMYDLQSKQNLSSDISEPHTYCTADYILPSYRNVPFMVMFESHKKSKAQQSHSTCRNFNIVVSAQLNFSTVSCKCSLINVPKASKISVTISLYEHQTYQSAVLLSICECFRMSSESLMLRERHFCEQLFTKYRDCGQEKWEDNQSSLALNLSQFQASLFLCHHSAAILFTVTPTFFLFMSLPFQFLILYFFYLIHTVSAV